MAFRRRLITRLGLTFTPDYDEELSYKKICSIIFDEIVIKKSNGLYKSCSLKYIYSQNSGTCRFRLKSFIVLDPEFLDKPSIIKYFQTINGKYYKICNDRYYLEMTYDSIETLDEFLCEMLYNLNKFVAIYDKNLVFTTDSLSGCMFYINNNDITINTIKNFQKLCEDFADYKGYCKLEYRTYDPDEIY